MKKINFEAEADRMLQSVHLVGEDEDDLYSGFNEYNPAFDTEVRSDVPTHMIFCAHQWSIQLKTTYALKLMLFSDYIRKSLNLIDFSFPVFIELKLTREVFPTVD